jgi:predicted LPLAT superfamily acyltransferase
MTPAVPRPRNHGPSWGFRFLVRAQQLPRWFIRPLFRLGTWVALAAMPEQRRHSREFLTRLYGRPAGWRDAWRHFFGYFEFLLLRLRVAAGTHSACTLAPEHAQDFEALLASGEPALFGTFHFGYSDLLGFLLSERGRRVAMIRLRVDNSEDTDMLERQFGGAVSFIWVNEPENLLFAVKSALDRGESLAMQCDRFQFSAKTEAFDFLGARRVFPFTIYHLAVLFGRPVAFCFGLPDGTDGTRVVATPVYRPQPGWEREANLAGARLHFQAVLTQLETLVRQHPTLWFNFEPLNPEVAPKSSS